jgi:hypothetical protein
MRRSPRGSDAEAQRGDQLFVGQALVEVAQDDPLNEGQNLTASFIDTQKPWRPTKSGLLEGEQQLVNEPRSANRPGAGQLRRRERHRA